MMTSGKNWHCRLGLHHFALVNDNNPELLKSKHEECVRCGKFKEIKEYTPTQGQHLAGGGM